MEAGQLHPPISCFKSTQAVPITMPGFCSGRVDVDMMILAAAAAALAVALIARRGTPRARASPRRQYGGEMGEADPAASGVRSEAHTAELQSREKLVCRLRR